MFKAQRTDGKGEVKGWLVKNRDGQCFIFKNIWFNTSYAIERFYQWEIEMNPVILSTISQQTGQTDKEGKDIYGSIEIDGVMTKGGDVIMLETCDVDKASVFFRGGAFWIKWLSDGNEELLTDYDMKHFEIIGKQYEVEDDK